MRFRWYAVVVTIAAVALAAFWLLLGQRYSPENFTTQPIVPDVVEFVWFGIALVAVVCALVVFGGRDEVWRDLGWAALPLAASSILVVSKAVAHATIQTYDMMLFCAAFGSSVVLWANRRWRMSNDSRALIAIWAFGVLLGMYFVWQQLYYWNNLALGYADCGLMASMLYNTVANPHELFLSVNPQQPMFWDHFSPGVCAFVPLWMLWPDVKLIIVLQVVVILGVAVPLFWLGKQVFQDKVSALLLAAAWLVYPATSQYIYNASYGFHWGNICLLLYFIALALWMKGRYRWAVLAISWALLIKEEVAIAIGMFGLYLAIFERRRWLGVTITAIAFGYFLFVTNVIIAPVKTGSYVQMRFFADLGNSMTEILLSPLTRPRIFWGRLFEARSWYFAAALLAPLLFFPLRRPAILFVGSLTFVFDCMYPMLKSISYHYQAALLPVLFWALAAALKDNEQSQRRAALTGVIAAATLLSLFLGNTFWSKSTLPIKLSPGRLALVRRLGRDIVETNSVFATQRIATHFINQRHLFTDPPVPSEIDFALCDLRDSWRGSTTTLDWLERLRSLQREIEAVPGLHLAAADDGLLFYSRRDTSLDAQRVVERDVLPSGRIPAQFYASHGVRIVAFTAAARPLGMRVTTFSIVAEPTNIDVAVRCVLRIGTDSYGSEFQPLGQGIWPVARWETNKFYADDFIVTLPAGLAQDVSSVSFDAVVLSP